MASTSASSIQKRFKYDVFLSFRGEDTRKTFVDHLYHALNQRGIITYKDDEKIKKGKRINDQLMRSIEDSRIYIIVFSKNYASSSWCLDELVKIMECHKTTGRTAYPVFFNVEPTEVRHQSGAVNEAFAKHEKKDAAGIWRDAMKAAADLAGRELKTTFDGYEAKFIQKVVEDISLELRFIDSRVDEKLIGMETRVKDVVSNIEADSDDVHVIGIKGIGGGGKTTLARAVFNYISIWYEGKSFVENVREASKGSGLKKLQQQVLKDVLNDKSIDIPSVYEGEMMMKKMLGSRKVLIVLDDVDDIEQLEALAGEHSWFKSGSTIIITTRDKDVLVAHRVKSIHDVNLLSHEEGIRLFSKYAFGREIPIEGYEELSRKVVHYAAGLPLTIKVLGSSLCGKTECEWSDAIERLKTIPEKQTLKRLELSFIGLEHDHKEVFLEVACILKGETKDKAIRILESCGFHARFALKVLEQKSLMTVSDYGCIYMHDRIEEMGRNIVRRLHPREPQRHNRLWDTKEIENILVNELGTKATLSIRLMYTKLHPTIIMKGLRKMKKLRFLYVRCWNHPETTNEVDIYLPNTLQSLHWDGYPFLCLPNTFSASKVVNLEMYHSKISQLWEGGERKVLNELRFLNISHSKLRTFDLGLTPQLEWLDLRECYDFVELHMPVESLKLKSLTLSGCMLSKHDMGLIPQLETLDLGECKDLVEFCMPVESPKLKSLVLNGSKLSKLDLGVTPQLEKLDLRQCKKLVDFRMPVESPKLKSLYLSGSKLSKLDLGVTPQLEKLDLRQCKNLVEFRMPVESPKLKSLDLNGSNLIKLDLGLTPQLETLDLGKCERLVELHMPVESPKLKSLDLSGSKLSKLDLRVTSQLEKLDIRQCKDLVELHMPVESPKLKSFYFSGSNLITLDLGLTPQLKTLDLGECERLVELHMFVESPELKSLILKSSKLRKLELGMTPQLKTVNLGVCKDLVELHMPVNSPNLKSLVLSGSKLSKLDLGLTPQLKTLDLEGCNDLVELHMPVESPKLKSLFLFGSKLSKLDLGLTPHLKTLDLGECKNLVELHMPVESPKLKSLVLNGSKLSKLDLGVTPQLETLDLGECKDLVELHMPVECLKLYSLVLSGSKLSKFDMRLTPQLETFLGECINLVELHMPVECPKLCSLVLSGSKLSKLDLGLTPQLKTLDLGGCKDLVELHMPTKCSMLKSLIISGSKLSKHNLGLTPQLERLDLEKCYYLQEIHAPVGCLENLVNLKLSGCLRFERFVGYNWYVLPCIDSLATVELIAESLDKCQLHPNNNLPKFQFKCFYEEPLPSSSGNLEMLLSFGMCACTNLESFSASICGLQRLRKLTLEGSFPEVPKDLYQLQSLQELTLSMKEIKHLPDTICMLKHLKYLNLSSCWLLEQLPVNLGQLECLEMLMLTDCLSLQDIPNNICQIRSLEYLHIPYCILVDKLPEELGRLECLKELNIEGAGISRLPQSIFELKGLRIIGTRWLLESYGFTSLSTVSSNKTCCYVKL